jgi:quercetin dioxygenase-like cupin family protein
MNSLSNQFDRFSGDILRTLGKRGNPNLVTLMTALSDLSQIAEPTIPNRTVSCSWLDKAFDNIPTDLQYLGESARKLADQACWQESQRNIPGVFEGGYAFVALIGPEGQLRSDKFKVGLFIQQPDIFYPPHAHNAEEFYFLLSGNPKWRAGKRMFTANPGDLIHHAPSEIHSMETMHEPFLAIWAWIGDINGNFWFPDGPSRSTSPSGS